MIFRVSEVELKSAVIMFGYHIYGNQLPSPDFF
jgi:hypothetical protein